MKRALILLLLLISGTVLAQTHPLLQAGPMLAYSEMREVAVWVQTKSPASVKLRYWPIAPDSQVTVQETPAVRTGESSDHIALFKLTNLPMGQKFGYELWINNQKVARDYPLEFQTQPHWRFAKNPAEPPTMKIAIGSCAYVNDTPFDRPGTPYGGSMEIFGAIHKERPDFMLWLGDNIYYREMDWLTEASMRFRWRHSRSLPELQPLLASTHHYAIWDDHDYGPNDSDRSFRLKKTALSVFEDYFPSVVRGTPDTRGCFFRFEWGDVEFFMLDDRYHRAPNRSAAGPDKVMLGKEQVQWLKDSLTNSNAAFKVIVNGGQMINPMGFFEWFGAFPDEQKELFDWLAASKIRGVLFLSGDRHATELLKVEWPGATYPWFEFTSSPLTAGPGRYAPEENNPARVAGTWVNVRNYGIIQVSGKRGERKLTLSSHDKDGKELWKQEIAEGQLREPRPPLQGQR